jgi:RNA polymerase sigma-70 factor (ECF subfamily)
MPYLKQLLARARALTPTQYDAEDLLQETLVRAYVSFDTFTEGTNLRAWLFRIMYNAWVSDYRARQRCPTEILTEAVTDVERCDFARFTPRGLASAEIEVLELLRDDEIASALDELPEASRLAVYLADVEGYRYREIAELMNTPVGTVMSRLHRGRTRLRRLLHSVAQQRGVLRDRSATDAVPALERAVT